jgi:hypothetical protein
VIAPFAATPPKTEVGARVMLAMVGLLIVSAAILPADPRVAVMSSTVAETTPVVVILNVALVAWAGTVTVAGYPTDESPPERLTGTPDVPVAAERVIVPVDAVPPVTAVG